MDLKKLLNEEQYEAATTVEGPLLILAGAGSGKTRVLTHRIAYMLNEKGINPYEILAITFTNKAAGEMRDRVISLVGDTALNMWISTFHSSCAKILRREIEALGYKKDFTIYDSYDQKSLVKQVMKELSMDEKDISDKEIAGEISNAKNLLIDPLTFKKNNEYHYRRNKIADAYVLYQKKLKQNNALDFDDLIMKTVELYEKFPEILDKYRRKFRYVLVDEYQDTNHAQYKLILLLTKEHKNICVVGDDDQSIYQFRGADIRNILDFEKDFPEAKVVKLEKNYRSMGNILSAANSVIKYNVERKEKTLKKTKDEGAKIKVYRAYNEGEEASFVVREMERQYREGRRYKEMAVLYRTNAQSRKFEEALIREGVPYKIIGGLRFYDRKEIKDILAYLRVINNPFDEVSLRRIINVPKRSIGNTTLDKLQELSLEHEESLFDTLLNLEEYNPFTARTMGAVMGFRDLILDFNDKQLDMKVSDLVDHILKTTGYLQELRASKSPEDISRVENLEEFVNVAMEYEMTSENPSLQEFLETVVLVSDIDSYEEESDNVTLMTLHSAKGLEFPVVFMVGMENGLFPGTTSLNDPKEMEESRRLAYVGITRAMEELYMTYAENRMVYGRTMSYPVSDFLLDIPSNLKEHLNDEKKSFRKEVNPHTIKYTDRNMKYTNYSVEKALEDAARILDIPEKTALTAEDLTLGIKVKHPKFGVGTVVGLLEESGDYKVTIAFDGKGVKTLILSLAPLELA
ncbi:DNA helicase PcrA [Proteiniclasticum sp. BAD-10]|uniref:ATP-dependent DNA helicase n=1 Tax=Proteiniclasticum sediminis TaxID=2804028 RepID=A0A941HRR4_9CLOT|nr:DNA helicase PcrA [Proteiniclasticum sediminis]MBR0576883.1 DNA helicase PcrA [Proteiniclasticum sediminis]